MQAQRAVVGDIVNALLAGAHGRNHQLLGRHLLQRRVGSLDVEDEVSPLGLHLVSKCDADV